MIKSTISAAPAVTPVVTEAASTAPTDRWLAALHQGPEPVALPPLTGTAATAERLLLLLHYGIDWERGWAGTRRATYWDKVLPDRVVSGAYLAGGSLRRWWTEVTAELESAPRTPAERLEVTQLLEDPDAVQVLEVLRGEAEALTLRVRIIADAVRAARTAGGQVAS